MSNPPNNSNTGSSNLFGGSAGTSNAGSGSLFGGMQNAGASTGQSPFGNAGSGLFGPPKPAGDQGAITPNKASSGTSLFGNANASSDQTPKNSFSFGAPSTTPIGPPPSQQPASSLFGGTSILGNNSKENKSGESSQTTSGSQSLFGNIGGSTKPLFGGQTGQSASSPFAAATKPNTSTDASKPATTSLFGNTATQAPKAPSPSLFGGASTATASPSNLFGGTSGATSQTSTNLFGAGGPQSTSNSLFAKPADKPNQNASTPNPNEAKPSLFGQPASKSGTESSASKTGEQSNATSTGDGTSSTPSLSLFGSKPSPAAQSSSTVGNMGANGSASGATPANAGASASGGAPSNPFAGLGQPKEKTNEPAKPAAGDLFAGSGSTPASNSLTPGSTSAQPAATTAKPDLFGGLGGTKPSETASGNTPKPSSSTLFGGLGASKPAEAIAKPAEASTTLGSATAPAGVPSLFAPKATTEGKDAQPAASGSASTTNQTTDKSTSSGVPVSTTGPPPSAQSRLKNKSMDDIVTRWATDLAKYQKEFQKQAEKVAEWDNIIVKNANTIGQLYSKTFQAERDTAEVQKQLSAVEESQTELESWLDRYEREVNEIAARQIGQGEGMSGPDQERERTYKTAERVSERLTDMSSDLTAMIEEINASTAAMSKSSKSDDPVSQIVRVLNGHLQQLQQIDVDTQALQSKVHAAQQQSSQVMRGGYSNGADDFYKSIMSSR